MLEIVFMSYLVLVPNIPDCLSVFMVIVYSCSFSCCGDHRGKSRTFGSNQENRENQENQENLIRMELGTPCWDVVDVSRHSLLLFLLLSRS